MKVQFDKTFPMPASADTAWTQKMRPHFRDMLRIECRRYARAQ